MAQDGSGGGDKTFDVYIHDYLVKRNLLNTAKIFQAEGNVSRDPVSIDAPQGFLYEWWLVFWDYFMSSTKDTRSDVSSSYIETTQAREQEPSQLQEQQQYASQQLPHQTQMQQLLLQRYLQQQQQQQHASQQLPHQTQTQQLLLQRYLQQQQQQQRQQQQEQHRQNRHQIIESSYLNTSTQNGLACTDIPRQHNTAATSLFERMYGDKLTPFQMDTLDEASTKMLEANMASIMESTKIPAQALGQMFEESSSSLPGTWQQAQARNLFQESTQGIKEDTSATMNLNLQDAGVDMSLLGVPDNNLARNNLTLQGWPLTSPQEFHHPQFFTPQQQQLLHQAQQNMASSFREMDIRRLQMLLSSRNNASAEIIPGVGTSLHNMSSPIQPMEMDFLMNKITTLHQQQQPSNNDHQFLQVPSLSQQPQSSNQHSDHHEKVGFRSVTMDRNLSNSFCENDQVYNMQNGQKGKQSILLADPINNSGIVKTTSPFLGSAPPTPSIGIPGDITSIMSTHHNAILSKAKVGFGDDAPMTMETPKTPLDEPLEDNVDLFLSHDECPGDSGNHSMTPIKGIALKEISSAQASTNKIVCCHLSSDGKLLATGGNDKKVVLWNTDTLQQKSILNEHSHLVTDVRISPSTPYLATSSFDNTVRVWDVNNDGYSIRTFIGHSTYVKSLDFHPNKEDLICSCDGDNEIRFWSINKGTIIQVFKGGSNQLRFQPRLGGYLAVASENVVSVLDVETQACIRRFEGHTNHVDSLCWDSSGEYIVSASEDTVKVWSLNAGTKENCVHELNIRGKKFHSCIFHPLNPSMIVVGCYKSLELWNVLENKSMTVPAHDSIISGLSSSSGGVVASVSHDKHIKLWR